jgi:hypothetical protein
VPAGTDGTVPEQRIVEKCVLLPPGGAVTGWAALRLRGGAFFDGRQPDGRSLRPVPLVIGPRLHRAQIPDVAYVRDRLDEADVTSCRGIPCAVPERAVFDEMRRAADVRAAVVAMDMAAAAQLTSIARVGAYVDAHPGWDGVPLARAALRLAVETSRSPRETEMRLIWVLDARLPTPLVNREIFDLRSGVLLGIGDLLDPVAGVVGEFDGGEHSGAGRRSRDAQRDGLFRDHGLEVFRVTSVDLRDPRAVVERAFGAYRRAACTQPRRSWTIEPPPGWEPALSLDEILTARDLVREMHEQWERRGDPQHVTR